VSLWRKKLEYENVTSKAEDWFRRGRGGLEEVIGKEEEYWRASPGRIKVGTEKVTGKETERIEPENDTGKRGDCV